jgi:hypothetical protein
VIIGLQSGSSDFNGPHIVAWSANHGAVSLCQRRPE